MNCIFCKIAAGEIPSMKIYEDDHVFSFLDIGPLSDGHTLVIPKKHFSRLEDMSPEDVAAVTRVLPKIAAAVLRATGAPGYNVLQNNGQVSGQAVDHVHFHIIPRAEGDGLGYRWNAKKYPPGKDRIIHEKILEQLK